MLLIALLLAADSVSITQEAQIKDLCDALRDHRADPELDPAQQVAAAKAAQMKREEAAGRWYRLEVPSKGFTFGRYREQDQLIELDGDRPLRAVDNMLSLDLDGIDDVAFHATPEQVSAWSRDKKAGTLRLVVVWKPTGERCAGSAAAESWRIAGKARSWELAGESGTVAAADAEGEPVGAPPREVKVDKVTLESDDPAREDDGRRRLAGAQRELQKCIAGAQRGGSLVVSFNVQDGRVRDPQVIMDSLRDEKVAGCVAHAVSGAEVGGSGHGTAAISLE
jgi:hypothetical protein